MPININEPNIRVQQPPPAAFQGKTVEQVVLDLMARVSTLEAKLTASKDRIAQLETKVEQLQSGVQGLPQKVSQHTARLDEQADMLAEHHHDLGWFKAVFKLDLYGNTGSNPIQSSQLKVTIRAMEIKFDAFSKLTAQEQGHSWP